MQEKNDTLQSAKMRSMPMGRLLLNMSLPAIISMFIDALYTIVDSMFLSQYSQVAFEAVGISFPMVMIKISLALGIGVGANVFISRKLGEGDREGADNVARTAVFLSIIGSLLFVALAFTVSVPFMKLFTEDAEMIDMGNEYLIYMLGLSVFSVVSIVAQKLLQATGNMKAPMVSQALGAIVNIILDPIFIFDEFWGMKCLNMGVAGAAIATIIGQFVACAYVILVFIVKKHGREHKPRQNEIKMEHSVEHIPHRSAHVHTKRARLVHHHYTQQHTQSVSQRNKGSDHLFLHSKLCLYAGIRSDAGHTAHSQLQSRRKRPSAIQRLLEKVSDYFGSHYGGRTFAIPNLSRSHCGYF